MLSSVLEFPPQLLLYTSSLLDYPREYFRQEDRFTALTLG